MKNKIILTIILIVSAFLRLTNLSNLPSSYTPDELAQGYTAYSILKTGKDEWRSTNWLNLRSFGDYKPPLQTLLMIPSVKLFGLNTFAVRFPNAFLSIFTVLLTYLIATILFKNSTIGIVSAIFMAISPWSLPMSRIALEANLVIFIVSLATYLLLKSQQKNSLLLAIISGTFFGVSLFTYHSAKIFTPLFLILFIFFQKTYQHKKILVSILISFFLFLFLNLYNNQQIENSRTGDIAIFNPTDKWSYVSDSQFEMTQNGLPYLVVKMFYNKIIYLYETFSHNYLSYFSPQFLITQGAGETTYGMIPGYGVLGLIPGIGFFLTFIFLIQSKTIDKEKRNLIFLFGVILIPPLIAAIAKGQYSGNRVSLMMPFIQIISAFGLVNLVQKINLKFQLITKLVIFVGFTFTSLVFLQRYYFQGNQTLAQGMLYGHKQANEFIKSQSVDQIIYSRKLSEPQAYVTFFNQINPLVVQSESVNWFKYQKENLLFLDQLGEYNLDKFIFREINIVSDSQIPNALIIGRPEEFRDTKPDYIIYYPSKANVNAAMYIYKTKI